MAEGQMPADEAARYQVMVQETLRLWEAVFALAAENATLRRALGLWPSDPDTHKPRTFG